MSKRIENSMVPVVLLAGGRGMKTRDERIMPKALVDINGTPLLEHIMNHYSSFGFRRFIICTGMGGEMITDHFASVTDKPWEIEIVATGENTKTGGRLKKIERYLGDAEYFCVTYTDTYADVDIDKLIDFHHENSKIATLTAAHLPTRFRVLGLYSDEPELRGIAEKPILQNDYINGGYYVFEKNIFSLSKLTEDDNCTLEEEVLEQLVEKKEICAMRHGGVWQYFDNERDRLELCGILENK